MNKVFQKRILITLAVLTACCLAVAIFSSRKASLTHDELNEQRYQRMVAEEKLEKAKTKIRLQEGQIEKLQKERDQLDALLREEKGAIANLRTDVEKGRRLNEILQRELQNALMGQSDRK